jgi:hypothetical protein
MRAPARWISLALALCDGALACTNVTGNPRLGDRGSLGPVPGAMQPDRSDNGTMSLADGGGGTMTPITKPPVTISAGECLMQTLATATQHVPAGCVDCSCRMRPAETAQCTDGCWTLIACVLALCEPTDTACIIERCAPAVGGAANLASIATLTRQTPVLMCSAQCNQRAPSDAGGVENDL